MRYTARCLPKQTGRAAWNAILPPRSEKPRRLDGDRTADVVVVGAGFAGLSAARRLQQLDPGLRIAVLEAGQVAEGAAGRNSGFMIDLPHDLASDDYAGNGDDAAMIALNRRAIAFAKEAVGEYDIAADYFDPAGKVNGAASEAAVARNRSYAAHLAKLGEESTLLDQQQMADLTGSRHYKSGLFTPGTVMLQPAGYVRGLRSGLAARGVDVFEETPAQGFVRQGNDWKVETPAGSIITPHVILTVNGHLESFGIARGRLMQLFLFAVMTPELRSDQLAKLGGQHRWGITPSDPMGTTVRRIDTGQGGNRIVTRTCAVLRSGMEAKSSDLHRAAKVMQDKFDARFPQLAGLKMEHAWAGHLCLSRNGVAVMKEVETGVYAGCVQNGLGTARGTLTGMGAAELLMGVDSDITRHFSAEASPAKLPPKALRDLGANLVLRTKEWQARQE